MNARIEIYLKAYNLVQLTGWFLALVSLPFSFMLSFYTVCFVQILSLLEIFHAYKKWNNSSPLLCFIQIAARLFILFFTYLLIFFTIFKEILFFYTVVYSMLLAWFIAEIIRYAYYVSGMFNVQGKLITWLRYSAFIICYPVGVIAEFFIMYTVFKYDDLLSIKILMIIVALVYLYFFPKLYLHLFKQRKLKLIH